MQSAARNPTPHDSFSSDDRKKIVEDRRDLRARVDLLWEAIHERCKQRQIEPGIATSKRELTQLLRAADKGATANTALSGRLASGWRRELLGPVLESAIKPSQ